eukprot:6475319-Amphidinium_carterae.1
MQSVHPGAALAASQRLEWSPLVGSSVLVQAPRQNICDLVSVFTWIVALREEMKVFAWDVRGAGTWTLQTLLCIQMSMTTRQREVSNRDLWKGESVMHSLAPTHGIGTEARMEMNHNHASPGAGALSTRHCVLVRLRHVSTTQRISP